MARVIFPLVFVSAALCYCPASVAAPSYNIATLGLVGPEHTRDDDYKSSLPSQQNEAGAGPRVLRALQRRPGQITRIEGESVQDNYSGSGFRHGGNDDTPCSTVSRSHDLTAHRMWGAL